MAAIRGWEILISRPDSCNAYCGVVLGNPNIYLKLEAAMLVSAQSRECSLAATLKGNGTLTSITAKEL